LGDTLKARLECAGSEKMRTSSECLKKERGEAEKREDREEQEYSVG
jgi:hypothetical protein